MRRALSASFLALFLLAHAAEATIPDSSESLCRQAIAPAARAHNVPPTLMAAIARVESGRRDSAGRLSPWPWTVDVEGQGSFHESKTDAIATVQAAQARGTRSIDVGCMQVNLMHHPTAFASLAQAFDPSSNADYAARFLRELFDQTGSWPKAAALYHSATPEIGAEYERKVMAAWPEEQRLDGGPVLSPLANAWAATLRPVGFPPPARGIAARVNPFAMASGAAPPPGRGLEAYRASPIQLVRPRLGG